MPGEAIASRLLETLGIATGQLVAVAYIDLARGMVPSGSRRSEDPRR